MRLAPAHKNLRQNRDNLFPHSNVELKFAGRQLKKYISVGRQFLISAKEIYNLRQLFVLQLPVHQRRFLQNV
jgi:hypothetical protein